MSNKDQREAVKTLAIAVGVREAARRLNLNENTVISWSKRDNWQIQSPKPNGPIRNQPAIKPSVALQEVLTERSHKTKLNLSKAVLKASKTLGGLSGEVLINEKVAGSARNWTGVAKDVHGWGEEKDQGKGMFGGLRVYATNAVIGINQDNPDPS